MELTPHQQWLRDHFLKQSAEYTKYELISRQRGKFDDAFQFQEHAKQTQYGDPPEALRGVNWHIFGQL